MGALLCKAGPHRRVMTRCPTMPAHSQRVQTVLKRALPRPEESRERRSGGAALHDPGVDNVLEDVGAVEEGRVAELGVALHGGVRQALLEERGAPGRQDAIL